jgi:hypothetical protein
VSVMSRAMPGGSGMRWSAASHNELIQGSSAWSYPARSRSSPSPNGSSRCAPAWQITKSLAVDCVGPAVSFWGGRGESTDLAFPCASRGAWQLHYTWHSPSRRAQIWQRWCPIASRRPGTCAARRPRRRACYRAHHPVLSSKRTL